MNISGSFYPIWIFRNKFKAKVDLQGTGKSFKIIMKWGNNIEVLKESSVGKEDTDV